MEEAVAEEKPGWIKKAKLLERVGMNKMLLLKEARIEREFFSAHWRI